MAAWRATGMQHWNPTTDAEAPKRPDLLKVILFGPQKAGKSSLMQRIANDTFSATYMVWKWIVCTPFTATHHHVQSTIGVDFAIHVKDGRKLQVRTAYI